MSDIPLREYVDQRFADEKEKTRLALEAVARADTAKQSGIHNVVSWLALLIAIGTMIAELMRK